jgi:hypothetical protein
MIFAEMDYPEKYAHFYESSESTYENNYGK